MDAVKATRLLNYDAILEAGKPAGAFSYFISAKYKSSIVGMLFICPCGCGTLDSLNFDPSRGSRPCWTFDGNLEKPTLIPSIHRRKCGWHGYLTDGVFKPC